MKNIIGLALVGAAVLTVEVCFPVAAVCVAAALVLTGSHASRTN